MSEVFQLVTDRFDLFRQGIVRNYLNIQDSRVDSLRVVGWSEQFFVKLQLDFSLVRNTLNIEGQSGTHFQRLLNFWNIKTKEGSQEIQRPPPGKSRKFREVLCSILMRYCPSL